MSGTTNGTTMNSARRPRSLYDDPGDEKLSLKIDNISSQQKTPGFVYVLTFFSALGGFLFGYDTGVISGAMILLRNEFQLSLVWQEYIVSVTVAAAALFAPIGGFLNDRFGRKPVIMAASVVFTVGALCMGIAGDKYLLLAGRIIVGAGIGLTSTTIPMYLAECSPANERGRLVSTNIAMVACGQFVASVVDGIFGWCQYDVGWRYMLGLAGIPSFIQFLGFVFMPESPRWLIINEREEYARRVLQTMRGHFDIDEEFDSIKNSYIEGRDGEVNTPVIIKMFQTPSVRRALFVGCGLQLFQQLSGINTVMYYSATIIRMSGVTGDETTIWLSAFTAAVNFIFTILGLFLVEKIGRRALTLGSLIGAVLSLAWLAVGFQLSAMNTPTISLTEQSATGSKCQTYLDCNSCMRDLNCGYCYVDTDSGPENGTCLRANYDEPFKAVSGRCNDSQLPGDLTWAYDYCPTQFYWMPMIGLVAYLIFFAPGMGPMPWTVNSEIYPSWARSTGNAASTFTNWIVNLAMSMSFLSLTQTLTRFGTFWLYSGLALVGLIVLALYLPETKGKTLEEVEGLFARPWCCTGPKIDYNIENIQYVHIRGLNRDGRESEIDSPD